MPFTPTDATATTTATHRQIADPQKQHTSTSSVDATESRSLNTGAIVGGVIGGLALLAALSALLVWSRYRRHHGSKRAFFIVQKGPGLGPGTSRPNTENPASTTSRSTVAQRTAYQPIPTIHLSSSTEEDPAAPQSRPLQQNERASPFELPIQHPSTASFTNAQIELINRPATEIDSRPCMPTLPPARSAGRSNSELEDVSVREVSGREGK